MYVGRAEHDYTLNYSRGTDLLPGRVDKSHGGLFVPWGKYLWYFETWIQFRSW